MALTKEDWGKVRSNPLFADIGEEDLRDLVGERSLLRFARNKSVFEQGDKADAFFLILDGQIKLSRINRDGNEAVVFVDAVHPTHAARPAGCWALVSDNPAIEQTSGRQRINIHGAIDLETGQTRMIKVETVDAASTIRLLESIMAAWPMMALIHVYLDNARYHHAKLVREWLQRPGCRIKLHFIPAYCPHLNPIERL
jgi:CRP-like cAMP-binding protein